MTPEQIGAAGAEVDKTIREQYGDNAMACAVVLVGDHNFTVLNVGANNARQQLSIVLATRQILSKIACDLSSGTMTPPVIISRTPVKKEDLN